MAAVADLTLPLSKTRREEEASHVHCTCPLCKGDLPDGYILVKRGLLDSFAICSRCGYAWEKNRDAPKRCPNCGSFKWANPPTQNHCLRCGHEWNSRRETKPSKCPSCRSKNWNKTDREMLDEEIAMALKMFKEVPENEEDSHDDDECEKNMQAAVQRCLHGEGVYRTAVELSVPILDLILNLKSKGADIRIK